MPKFVASAIKKLPPATGEAPKAEATPERRCDSHFGAAAAGLQQVQPAEVLARRDDDAGDAFGSSVKISLEDQPAGTGGIIKHWPSIGARKITSTTSQAQSGRPRKTTGLRFSLTTGLGSGVWQRQQTSLSSGFHVLQLGQFIASPFHEEKS
jgi:hypothetical protein